MKIEVPRLAVEINRRGFQALCDHLGMAGALRFMLQYDLGAGDYVRERQALIEGLSLEDVLALARHPPQEK